MTDNNASTPFKKGANAIIITTSLFANTKLNGLLMQERLAETPLYAVGDDFQMISCNRDEGAESDGSSSHVDFVIIRQEISSGDAMEVLDLLLTCIVNETLDETNQTVPTEAVLYTYISTKDNFTEATEMSLPSDVIKYVPWNNPYINSPQSGILPSDEDDLGENVRQEASSDAYAGYLGGGQYPEITLEALGEFLELFGFVGDVIAMVVAVIIELTMFLLSFLEPLLWLILRAILLILIFLILAFEIIMTVPIYLAVGVGLSLLSSFNIDSAYDVQYWVDYGEKTRIGFLELDFEGQTVNVESYIKWKYWAYFDLWWPYSDMEYELLESIEGITGVSEEEFLNGTNLNPTLHCGFIEVSNLNYQFTTTYSDYDNDEPNSVKLYLVSPLGNEHSYDMNITQDGYKSVNYWEAEKITDWIDDYTGQEEYFDYDEVEEEFTPDVWDFGVNYTTTIDFEQEFTAQERDGQWYYYYKAEDSNNNEGVWPTDPYGYYSQLGPRVNIGEEKNFLTFSHLNSTMVWEDEDILFTAYSYHNTSGTIPQSVNITLQLSDYSTYTLEMNLEETYDFDEDNVHSFYFSKSRSSYNITLNLCEELNINSDTELYYYFDAEFSSGDHSLLLTGYYDESTDISYSGMFGPISVFTVDDSGVPEIKNYWCETTGLWEIHDFALEILSDKKSTFSSLYPGGTSYEDKSYDDQEDPSERPGNLPIRFTPIVTNDETIMRFTVGIKDIDDNPNDLEVKLILTSLDPSDERVVELEMEYYNNHSGLEWFFVDLYKDVFSFNWTGDVGDQGNNDYEVWQTEWGSGAWKISFEVEDGAQNTDVINAPRRVWHAGSLSSFVNTLYGGPAIALFEPEWAEIINPMLGDFGSGALNILMGGGQGGNNIVGPNLALLMGVLINTAFTAAYGVAAGFILTNNPGYQKIGKGIALATMIAQILFQVAGFVIFLTLEDTGALLGAAAHSLISLLLAYLGLRIRAYVAEAIISDQALKMFTNLSPGGDPTSLLKYYAKFVHIISIMSMICLILMNPLLAIFFFPILLNQFESVKAKPKLVLLISFASMISLSLVGPFVPDLEYYADFQNWVAEVPLPIFAMLGSGLALGAFLGIIDIVNYKGVEGGGKAGSLGSTLEKFIGFSAVLGVVEFIAFMVQSQLFYIWSDIAYAS